MGGYGSGRRWSSKETTADHRPLDVRRLHRDELLERRDSFNWRWSRNGESVGNISIHPELERVVLKYRYKSAGEDWMDQEYPVSLERTPCRYGGGRVWFRCPARGCGRRVAILYSGKVFACRHCYRLACESQREATHDRALRTAQSVHQKLGGSGIIDDPVSKPKGMHWRTYTRHMDRLREAESMAIPPWLLRLSGIS